MKKKLRFLGLLALAPLTLLAACTSVPELSVESNWLRYTALKSIPPVAETAGVIESLDYTVIHKRYDSMANEPFQVTYSNGKYHTELSAENVTVGDKTEFVYMYRTTLTIDVQFFLNDAPSEKFTDTMTTETQFYDADSNLKPIRSKQTVESHVPATTPSSAPASLEENQAFVHYHYSNEYDYTEANKAKIKSTNLLSEEPAVSETTVSTKKGKGSYYDNEQIVFLLRGVDLSSSMSFRSIDPSTKTVSSLKVSEGPTAVQELCNFTLKDGTKVERAIDAYEISLSYNKKNGGSPKKFVYAKKVSSENNTYRNVLLRFEQNVLNSHGTFTYQLTKASFSEI